MTEPLGVVRIERILVTGLFGLYDHAIDLNQNDRVTILHGPNGVGKSVLLKFVAAFFSGRFQEFAHATFESIFIRLTDGHEITIEKPIRKDSRDNNTLSLRINISAPQVELLNYEVIIRFAFDRVAGQLERVTPYLARIADDQYFDYRASSKMTSEDVVKRYGTAVDFESCIVIELEKEPERAKRVRDSVAVQLVETQRLLRTPPDSAARTDRRQLVATVKTYSEDLVGQIARTLSSYGSQSTRLDQTFPQRLIRGHVPSLSIEELKAALHRLDERHTELSSLGLLEKAPSYPVLPSEIDRIDSVTLNVMALVVNDTDQKLNVLDEIAQRIKLLLASVNGKFRNKALTINRERGLQFTDSRGRHIPLESLSSGEQHELVLWFDLLFKVSKNTLVMIDEPELSLHVTWQKRFLPELLEIAKAVPFDALLATHSPYIIGDRLDLTVPLDAEID